MRYGIWSCYLISCPSASTMSSQKGLYVAASDSLLPFYACPYYYSLYIHFSTREASMVLLIKEGELRLLSSEREKALSDWECRLITAHSL